MIKKEQLLEELELIEIILEGNQETDKEKVQEALLVLKRVLK